MLIIIIGPNNSYAMLGALESHGSRIFVWWPAHYDVDILDRGNVHSVLAPRQRTSMFANLARGGAPQTQVPASVALAEPHSNAAEVAANGVEILSSMFTLCIACVFQPHEQTLQPTSRT